MEWLYTENVSGGMLRLLTEASVAERRNPQPGRRGDMLYTLVYNTGSHKQVVLDGITCTLPAYSWLPVMFTQQYFFSHTDGLVMWQFNREFYCIVNHDKEVGCAGLLFYGAWGTMVLQTDEALRRKCGLLFDVFREEFENRDNIQGPMLRMLLVRLIIMITRVAKNQYIPGLGERDERFELLRRYNLMVEQHYKEHHEVKFYAQALYKSPKTLANSFARFGSGAPLQIIHGRLVLEARRYLQFTDAGIKEIAAALGFEDAGHFTRFFKKQAGMNPTEYRKAVQDA